MVVADHCQVRFDVLHKLPSSRPTLSHSFRDFSGANWDQIKLFLANLDLNNVFHDDLPARDIIDNFYVILNDCLDRFVPFISRKINSKARLFNYPFSVRKKILRNLKRGDFIVHFGLLSR
jgi:hypothetical protein